MISSGLVRGAGRRARRRLLRCHGVLTASGHLGDLAALGTLGTLGDLAALGALGDLAALGTLAALAALAALAGRGIPAARTPPSLQPDPGTGIGRAML